MRPLQLKSEGPPIKKVAWSGTTSRFMPPISGHRAIILIFTWSRGRLYLADHAPILGEHVFKTPNLSDFEYLTPILLIF